MALSSPAPTHPPDAQFVAHRLQLRTETPTTCGYVDGNFASPITCSAGYSCSSNTFQKVHNCCALAQCFPPTTCIDSTAYNTACNATCRADLSTLKCTSSTNSYCYSLAWGDGMSQFGCAPSPYTQKVQLIYTGDGPSSGGTSLLGTSTQGGGPASTSTSPAGISAPSGSSLSTPTIVGISAGSIAVLAILSSLSFFRCRRRPPRQPSHIAANNGSGNYLWPPPPHSSVVAPSSSQHNPWPQQEQPFPPQPDQFSQQIPPTPPQFNPWPQAASPASPYHNPWSQQVPPYFPPVDHSVAPSTSQVDDVDPSDSISNVGSLRRSPGAPLARNSAPSQTHAPGTPSYAPSTMQIAPP